jgi:ABC-2 type transport system ATP-binding protein
MNTSREVPIVELKHVTKRFGDTVAVDSLDLSLPPGTLFGFIGPNGAGKTTTIKLITGLLQPTSGRVFVNGIDIRHEPERAKRLIGYVPDNPFLYDVLTGREFLRFVGRLYRMDASLVERRIGELFELFQVGSWGDFRAEEYSHGMRQKIVISAALLHQPKLIVIDEPMVGLDPKSIRLVKRILEYQSRMGTAIFMSTHTLAVAEEISSLVGIIDRGRVIAQGTVAELRRLSRERHRTLEDLYLELTTSPEESQREVERWLNMALPPLLREMLRPESRNERVLLDQ